ncbi:MAG: pyridoxal-phosphate dependent enzyme [Candidatus Bathyarchaeota archaeon]|nr:pyridoxal-phosphate dependent enzyme [Candidatus Bathyarchaeota archaeon]
MNVFVQVNNQTVVQSDSVSLDSYLKKLKILKTIIGNTPLIQVDKVNGNQIHAKLEYFNPLSHSVKDRSAVYMFEGVIRKELANIKDRIFIEASSGNFGIAYGLAGQFLGLKTMVVIPSVVGQVTFNRVKKTGAIVEKTPDGYCPRRNERDGAIVRVKDLWLNDPQKEFLNQYSNSDNIRAHYEGTGPEIWRQSKGKVKVVVMGTGTGGSIIGTASYLKKMNPEIKCVAVQPQENHHIQGLRNYKESLEPEIIRKNRGLIDDWIEVSDRDAFLATEFFWQKGFYVGTSSGLNYVAARKIAKKHRDVDLVTLFPDTGLNSFKLMQRQILKKRT